MSDADPRPDLFALVASNAQHLDEQLAALSNEPHGPLEPFRNAVEQNARLSCNAQSRKVISLLLEDRYPTPYEVARRDAEASGRSAEELLKERQGDYYPRRVGFDRHFHDGEGFTYAALNLGNCGPRYYGPYCLVLRTPQADDRIALLPCNSLTRYIDPTGTVVDDEAIRRQGGPWSHRAHVATLKHATQVPHLPPEAWPDLVCSPHEKEGPLIEAILGDPVRLARVERCRVSKTDDVRLKHLAARLLAGDAVGADELGDHRGHLEVILALEKHGRSSLYEVA